jgi:hypothetical protein
VALVPSDPPSTTDMLLEPRSLSVVAWYDGWTRATTPGAKRREFLRRLTDDELESWREGWMQGLAENREWEERRALWAAGHA